MTLDNTLLKLSPTEPDVAALIEAHVSLMGDQTPPESCHVLTTTDLLGGNIEVYGIRRAGVAVSIGALRFEGTMAELKSMHTKQEHRGQGLARAVLRGLIDLARTRGLTRLALETGAGPEHASARALYASEGFAPCPPFGEYVEDPLSYFMDRSL